MSTLYCHFNFNHVRLSLDNKRLLTYLLTYISTDLKMSWRSLQRLGLIKEVTKWLRPNRRTAFIMVHIFSANSNYICRMVIFNASRVAYVRDYDVGLYNHVECWAVRCVPVPCDSARYLASCKGMHRTLMSAAWRGTLRYCALLGTPAHEARLRVLVKG